MEHWSSDLKNEIAALKERFQHLHEDFQNEWDRPAPQYVYHYTRLDILHKILESQRIRLYDVLTMRDEEELLHPLRIVSESMQPYWRKLPVDVTSFFHMGKQFKVGRALDAFIACFCGAAETQHMWRQYGDQGTGAAIQCRASDLRAQPKSHAVYPMMYNDAWFKELLLSSYEYVVGREWVDRFGFEEGKVINYKYCEQILTVLLCIKRECFRPESEWRALVLGGSPNHNTDGNGRRYVEIPLLECVSGIILGPRSSQSEAELRALLHTTPCCDVAVTRTEISI